MRGFIKILILSLVSIIGLSISIFGVTITKTFEIGAGTSQPFSHKRTFEVPCNTWVSAYISYSRLGRPGASEDVPLTITVMQPAVDGGEGEVVQTRQVIANTSLNSTTFNQNLRSPLGCSKTWSVRVKANEGISGFTVKGEIRISYISNLDRLLFSTKSSDYEIPITSNSSGEFIVYFQDPSQQFALVNSQGIIEVKGEWYHNLGLMPIKMRAELISPRGDIVAQAVGYAQNEVNPCCSGQKLKLIYRIPEFVEGEWKLRLKNISEHDAVNVRATGTFKRSCP